MTGLAPHFLRGGFLPSAALRCVREALETARVPGAESDARLLLSHVLGSATWAGMLADRPGPLTARQASRLRGLVRARLRRVPTAYLVGTAPFLEHTLRVGTGVLVPRPETEFWVDRLIRRLRRIGRPPARILDVGTGSGAIAIALARAFPGASVLATDRSPRALAIARRNGRGTRNLSFALADLAPRFGAPGGEFDLIVSNPPYIPRTRFGTAVLRCAEIAHEPEMALVSGAGGLATTRRLFRRIRELLSPEGLAAIEIEATEGAAAENAAHTHGLVTLERVADLAGRDRARFFARERAAAT